MARPQARSVYFTFQFYHFPMLETEPASLVPQHPIADAHAHGADASTHPQLLHSMALHPQQHGVRNNGVVVKYIVDPLQMRPHESGELVKYMYTKRVFVDIWETSSRLHLGSVSFPLRHLLRQVKGHSVLPRIVEDYP